MEGNTMRTLAEYIANLHRHRGDRNNYGTGEHAGFDTTINEDADREQGSGSGVGRCDKDNSGKSGNNL